jgi:hypothetical protein
MVQQPYRIFDSFGVHRSQFLASSTTSCYRCEYVFLPYPTGLEVRGRTRNRNGEATGFKTKGFLSNETQPCVYLLQEMSLMYGEPHLQDNYIKGTRSDQSENVACLNFFIN